MIVNINGKAVLCTGVFRNSAHPPWEHLIVFIISIHYHYVDEDFALICIWKPNKRPRHCYGTLRQLIECDGYFNDKIEVISEYQQKLYAHGVEISFEVKDVYITRDVIVLNFSFKIIFINLDVTDCGTGLLSDYWVYKCRTVGIF